MKILINESEILYYLVEISKTSLSDTDKETLKSTTLTDENQKEIIADIKEKIRSGKLQKFLRKIPGRIERAVKDDLELYYTNLTNFLKKTRHDKKMLIEKNFTKIVNKLGEENIILAYEKDKKIYGFMKTLGKELPSSYSIKRRSTYIETGDDCILRNTISNEKLIVNKINSNYPFWFVDAGYTNFIEKNKKWHRIVRNHLHFGNYFEAPVDRLDNFTVFPEPWRHDGHKILVIEPGKFSADLFNVDITQWKYHIEAELRKYTDKPIEFREKFPKKQRSPLYKHLLDEDYYCVVSINSNAATESIWAGIPIITLDKHITNPVGQNKISDINNLIRPHLANWLCMLSYSQFTVDEIQSGKAVKLINKYHDIS
jgi:hypothetical protein